MLTILFKEIDILVNIKTMTRSDKIKNAIGKLNKNGLNENKYLLHSSMLVTLKQAEQQSVIQTKKIYQLIKPLSPQTGTKHLVSQTKYKIGQTYKIEILMESLKSWIDYSRSWIAKVI